MCFQCLLRLFLSVQFGQTFGRLGLWDGCEKCNTSSNKDAAIFMHLFHFDTKTKWHLFVRLSDMFINIICVTSLFWDKKYWGHQMMSWCDQINSGTLVKQLVCLFDQKQRSRVRVASDIFCFHSTEDAPNRDLNTEVHASFVDHFLIDSLLPVNRLITNHLTITCTVWVDWSIVARWCRWCMQFNRIFKRFRVETHVKRSKVTSPLDWGNVIKAFLVPSLRA